MKNRIYITNRQKQIKLTDEHKNIIKKTVNAALRHEKIAFPCEISVTVTGEEDIRQLNSTHRGKDSVTDVLSFPLFEAEELKALTGVGEEPAAIGDIVLCAPRAYAQAQEYGHSFQREIAFLTVHSVLHLLGYDHEVSEEDDRYMNDTCETVLEGLGLTREYVGKAPEIAGETGDAALLDEDGGESDDEDAVQTGENTESTGRKKSLCCLFRQTRCAPALFV